MKLTPKQVYDSLSKECKHLEYLALDDNGTWFLYSMYPTFTKSNTWQTKDDVCFAIPFNILWDGDWKESLHYKGEPINKSHYPPKQVQMFQNISDTEIIRLMNKRIQLLEEMLANQGMHLSKLDHYTGHATKNNADDIIRLLERSDILDIKYKVLNDKINRINDNFIKIELDIEELKRWNRISKDGE